MSFIKPPQCSTRVWLGGTAPRLASHFDQVAHLADLPTHYRLDYPRRYEALAHVRAAILDHAREERTTG